MGGKLAKCERFVATSVNISVDSVCPYHFNQSDVVSCERFVYLTNEQMLLNQVRKLNSIRIQKYFEKQLVVLSPL